MGNTKYPCVSRRTKLPGKGVNSEVTEIGRRWLSQRRSCDRYLTVCSLFWHGHVTNEEIENDHVCLHWKPVLLQSSELSVVCWEGKVGSQTEENYNKKRELIKGTDASFGCFISQVLAIKLIVWSPRKQSGRHLKFACYLKIYNWIQGCEHMWRNEYRHCQHEEMDLASVKMDLLDFAKCPTSNFHRLTVI